MHLKELLREELICVNFTPEVVAEVAKTSGNLATDKWTAIEQLVDMLIEVNEIEEKDKQATVDALYKREKQMSTAIGEGIAIPHVVCDAVAQMTVALGICKSGLDFDSLDGQPVYLIILVVYPAVELQERLKTFASIVGLLNDESIRAKLISCNSCAEVLEIIREEETNNDNL